MYINEVGRLYVVYTNGETKEIGNVVGPQGADGTSVKITNISTNSDGDNIVTFSDGNKLTIKNGENGANGENGFSPIVSKKEIENGQEITITDASGDTKFEIFNG
jgi:hypothetical protein